MNEKCFRAAAGPARTGGRAGGRGRGGKGGRGRGKRKEEGGKGDGKGEMVVCREGW